MPETKELTDEEKTAAEVTAAAAKSGAEGGSSEEGSGEGKTFMDGKYASVEDLETGARKGQEHIDTLEQERIQDRERIRVLEDERVTRETQAQVQTTNDEQKNARQIAEEQWKGGKFLDAIRTVVASQLTESQKPIHDRAEATEREVKKQESNSAIKEMSADKVSFPKFDELKEDMGKHIQARIDLNPDYAKSFPDQRSMIEDAYSAVARKRSDLFKADPSKAAAAGGGLGSGARSERGLVPKSAKSDADKQKEAGARQTMGLDDNPFQDRLSLPDQSAAAREEELAAIARGDQ